MILLRMREYEGLFVRSVKSVPLVVGAISLMLSMLSFSTWPEAGLAYSLLSAILLYSWLRLRSVWGREVKALDHGLMIGDQYIPRGELRGIVEVSRRQVPTPSISINRFFDYETVSVVRILRVGEPVEVKLRGEDFEKLVDVIAKTF